MKQFLKMLWWRSYRLDQFLSVNKHLSIGVLKESPSICLVEVPKWDSLKDANLLKIPHKYDLANTARGAELANLLINCIKTNISRLECDIQDVFGLSSSKSTLRDFNSLDDLVTTNSQEMIDEITIEKLQENLKHSEIRIINSKNSYDHFVRKEWDGRLFLENAGGSHHFAAAKYLARLLNIPVPLNALLRESRIDSYNLELLADECRIYILKDDNTNMAGFIDELSRFRCSHMVIELRYPIWEGHSIIILDRKIKAATKAIKLFDKHGYSELLSYWRTVHIEWIKKNADSAEIICTTLDEIAQ